MYHRTKHIWALFLVFVIFSSCATGPAVGTAGSGVSVDVQTGATDVATNTVFTVTFPAAIDTSSVNTGTFFLVTVGTASADISPSQSALDTTICDSGNAIPAQVACEGALSCTLTPDSALDHGQEYALCLTSGITFADPNRDGFFSGTMVTFTTIFAYTVGGTVSGMDGATGLVLQNNETDDLTIDADGTFTFETPIENYSDYSVTVKTNPSLRSCIVTNGTGTIDGADITNVTVTCTPPWAMSVSGGGNISVFGGISTDTAGNSYAAGYVVGTGTFNFGNGATATGVNSSYNVVIVKYDPSGNAQWAKTVSSGGDMSFFNASATDPSGNVYAVGVLNKNSSFGFGGGVTAQSTYDGGYNAVIVKYDTNGDAQWAKTVSFPAGTNASQFSEISTDTAGNVYAVGNIKGTATFNFGNAVTAAGGYAAGNNVIIVKYDSNGDAQWASTVSFAAEGNVSWFDGVSIGADGNTYAAGYIQGTDTFNFGNSITAAGSFAGGWNPVLVKYDSTGTAQWARTVSGGGGYSAFREVSTDAGGNAYAVGFITETGTPYVFGEGVTVTGGYVGANLVIVKYDTNGNAQWAKTVAFSGAGNSSGLWGVTGDTAGNTYAAGYINGTTNIYDFGGGVTATGGFATNSSIVIVKYDSNGTAQWARSVSGGENQSVYYGVSIDAFNNVLATGFIKGANQFTFDVGGGTSVTAQSDYSGGNNAVIVRYVP